MSDRRVFQAKLDQLLTMLHFVRDQAKQVSFTHQEVDRIVLALEEALVNIISYGYPDDKRGTIEVCCEELNPKKGLKITIRDRGLPFNPLEHIPNEEDFGKEPDRLGGFGIFLIQEIMNHVQYERKNGQNVLTMTKFLSEAS